MSLREPSVAFRPLVEDLFPVSIRVDMDAQYPFASRDDIWRVFEELKELHAAQFEQAERIARLERRRDEDARLRSVWGPPSPFPTSIGGTIPTGAFLVLYAYGIIADVNCCTSKIQSFPPLLTPLKGSIKANTTEWRIQWVWTAKTNRGEGHPEQIVSGSMKVLFMATTGKPADLPASCR